MSDPRNLRRKALWITLSILGLIVLSVGGIFLDAWIRAGRVLEREERNVAEKIAEVRGERVLRPVFFEPEEEGNSWEPLAKALEFIKAIPEIEFKALPSFQTVADPKVDPERADKLIQRVAPATEDLRRALRRAWTEPDYPYEKHYGMDMRLTAPALKASRFLADAAAFRHDNGKTDEAVDFLILLWGLADRIAVKGPIVSHLIALNIREQASGKLRAMLSDFAFNGSQLARLQGALDRMASTSPTSELMSGYRVEDFLARSGVLHFAGAGVITRGDPNFSLSWRDGFSTRIMAARFFADREAMMAEMDRQVKEPHASRQAALNRLQREAMKSTNLLYRYTYPQLEGPWLCKDVLGVALSLARVSLAVARFRVDRGDFPATLADLVPAYLPVVPMDVINGAPFGYFVKDGTAHVYSRGGDGDDDGGVPVVRADIAGWNSPGDVVWTVKRK